MTVWYVREGRRVPNADGKTWETAFPTMWALSSKIQQDDLVVHDDGTSVEPPELPSPR